MFALCQNFVFFVPHRMFILQCFTRSLEKVSLLSYLPKVVAQLDLQNSVYSTILPIIEEKRDGFMSFLRSLMENEYKQSWLVLELGLPISFSLVMTIISVKYFSLSLSLYIYIYIYIYVIEGNRQEFGVQFFISLL